MSLLPVGIGPQEGGYQIERSLRFNSADSAYLSRTFTTPTNAKKFTISAWVKITSPSGSLLDFGLLSAGDSTDIIGISGAGAFGVSVNNRLIIRFGDANLVYYPRVFRDVSAWAHIVVAIDTDQAVQVDRAKFYYNGVLQTATSSTITSGYSPVLNTAATRYIGGLSTFSGYYANGYLAEYHFIDGQALDPTSFGEYNSETGVWQPKAYTGSYGTNGFYLNFSDNSGTTSTTLGKDYSGNSNNWTPNNFSVTAGAGNDSLVDTPTNYGTDTGVGGEVRGNYATLNPLLSSGGTTSNGNLQVTTTVGVGHSRATIAIPNSGKWYAEFTAISASTSTDYIFGIVGSETAEASYGYNQTPSYSYTAFGEKIVNGSFTSSFYSSFTTGDIIGCAVDLDTNQLTWYKNGTAQTAISITNGSYFWIVSDASGSRQITAGANFGQRPFAYTAPSGFKALCTQNLPEPTVVDGGDYFNTVLYAGTSPSTNSVTGVGFQPDLVWVKSRTSGTRWHENYDVLRPNKKLSSNATDAEYTENMTFDADGFTTSGGLGPNETGNNYVGWCWKAGGTGVTNTAGTITSTVSANTTAGFSIVTYTSPNLTADQTVGHGLGVEPSFIIVKNRTGFNWDIYHKSLGYNASLTFTTSGTRSGAFGSTINSTVFTTKDNYTHYSTNPYVAYCFAPVEGYSAFGSYTGNGSTDGPFVYTGFRPKFLLVKSATTAQHWIIDDTTRNPYNITNLELYPSLSNAESSDPSYDLLSNGFKLRITSANKNASGVTYIYAAFGDSFKFALGR